VLADVVDEDLDAVDGDVLELADELGRLLGGDAPARAIFASVVPS
jgi:hypothetical protein